MLASHLQCHGTILITFVMIPLSLAHGSQEVIAVEKPAEFMDRIEPTCFKTFTSSERMNRSPIYFQIQREIRWRGVPAG